MRIKIVNLSVLMLITTMTLISCNPNGPEEEDNKLKWSEVIDKAEAKLMIQDLDILPEPKDNNKLEYFDRVENSVPFVTIKAYFDSSYIDTYIELLEDFTIEKKTDYYIARYQEKALEVKVSESSDYVLKLELRKYNNLVPTITIDAPTSGFIGDMISVEVTVSPSDCSIVTMVTDPSMGIVPFIDNEFELEMEGTYLISVLAISPDDVLGSKIHEVSAQNPDNPSIVIDLQQEAERGSIVNFDYEVDQADCEITMTLIDPNEVEIVLEEKSFVGSVSGDYTLKILAKNKYGKTSVAQKEININTKILDGVWNEFKTQASESLEVLISPLVNGPHKYINAINGYSFKTMNSSYTQPHFALILEGSSSITISNYEAVMTPWIDSLLDIYAFIYRFDQNDRLVLYSQDYSYSIDYNLYDAGTNSFMIMFQILDPSTVEDSEVDDEWKSALSTAVQTANDKNVVRLPRLGKGSYCIRGWSANTSAFATNRIIYFNPTGKVVQRDVDKWITALENADHVLETMEDGNEYYVHPLKTFGVQLSVTPLSTYLTLYFAS